jgi:hypothetical protein
MRMMDAIDVDEDEDSAALEGESLDADPFGSVKQTK